VEVAAAHASAKAGHTNVAHRKQERDGSKVLSHRGTSTAEWGLAAARTMIHLVQYAEVDRG
jgi:hypothetical protein